MSVRSLLDRLKQSESVTPVTPEKIAGVTPRPANSLGCTPVTPVTPQINNNQSDREAALDERAAILEYEAGLSRVEAERQARLMTHAELFGYWSELEVETAIQRTCDFVRRGVPDRLADMIACRLVQRDRDQDDRRSCAECRAFQDGACIKGKAPVCGGGVEVLHRCKTYIDPEVKHD